MRYRPGTKGDACTAKVGASRTQPLVWGLAHSLSLLNGTPNCGDTRLYSVKTIFKLHHVRTPEGVDGFAWANYNVSGHGK